MLKTLWGAIESRSLNVDGRTAYRFRLGVTTEQLSEILWRGADWPPHWGMYVLRDHDHDHPVIPRAVRLRLESVGSEIRGVHIQIAGFEYLVAFERPPLDHFFRPAGMAFRRVGFSNRSCKMVAFTWPEPSHELIDVASAAPPSEDISKPSNPRAAAVQHQIMPGSFNVTSIRKCSASKPVWKRLARLLRKYPLAILLNAFSSRLVGKLASPVARHELPDHPRNIRPPNLSVERRSVQPMESFVCLLCDWAGTPEPVLAPSGGAGGIEFLPLQRGGFKPLLYALEVVMDGTELVRIGNFETRHQAAGLGIFLHNAFLAKGDFHCRVRPVRDYFGSDDTDPNLSVGQNENFVPR